MKGSSITEDLRKVLGDTRFCDMLFICSDGQEVPALRMLVAARSPVLQSMLLTSGMAETKLGRVPLEDIRAPVMHVCVEYIYTDHVEDSSWPEQLDEAMEVAAAARFFLIPGLEMHCIGHLKAALKHIEVPSLPRAGEMIRAYNMGAKLYHDQPNEKLDSLLNTFTGSVHSALIQSIDTYKLLSECGCLRLLEDVELSRDFSLREYHRLLLAIRWCASKVLMSNPSLEEDEMLDILDEFLPHSLEGLHDMLEKGCQILVDVHKLQMIKMLTDPLASFLDKASLDLSKVSPPILCTVFEPLQIIPCSKLLAAYRVHALYRPDLRWSDMYLHKSYVISALDPTEISCSRISNALISNSFDGFAAANMCVTSSHYLIFEWEIVMLEPCQNLQYGFCCGDRIAVSSDIGRLLGEQNRSVALGSTGNLYQNKIASGISGAHFYVLKGTKLGVHIDFLKGRCSFKVDGVIKATSTFYLGKGEGLYPAISMQNPGKGRLQMVLQESVLKKDILTMPQLDGTGQRDS